MELNQIKLYGKVIDLEVGDVFWQASQNGTVHYEPKGKNLGNIPRGNDKWSRARYCSCQKYDKQIRLSDNLEKTTVNGRTIWTVKYVYKQDRPEFDKLFVMTISSTEFKVVEVAVARMTDKLVFLKDYHPVTFLSRLEISSFLKFDFHYTTAYGTCLADDYEKLEELMFKGWRAHLKAEGAKLKQLREQLSEDVTSFRKLQTKNGY
jgi:hypothetical protein